MREEEASDDCWFMLPEEDDEDTNWLDFKVGVAGPVRCSRRPRTARPAAAVFSAPPRAPPTPRRPSLPPAQDVYAKAPAGASAPGPRPSPFAGGVFRVRLVVPDTYPAAPPEAHFATKTWYPRVDWASGKVCMDDVLGGAAWVPSLGLRGVLAEVRAMLAAVADGGVNAEALKEMQEDLDAFDKHAREMTLRYATD